jgi:hypothetical protein
MIESILQKGTYPQSKGLGMAARPLPFVGSISNRVFTRPQDEINPRHNGENKQWGVWIVSAIALNYQ